MKEIAQALILFLFEKFLNWVGGRSQTAISNVRSSYDASQGKKNEPNKDNKNDPSLKKEQSLQPEVKPKPSASNDKTLDKEGNKPTIKPSRPVPPPPKKGQGPEAGESKNGVAPKGKAPEKPEPKKGQGPEAGESKNGVAPKGKAPEKPEPKKGEGLEAGEPKNGVAPKRPAPEPPKPTPASKNVESLGLQGDKVINGRAVQEVKPPTGPTGNHQGSKPVRKAPEPPKPSVSKVMTHDGKNNAPSIKPVRPAPPAPSGKNVPSLGLQGQKLDKGVFKSTLTNQVNKQQGSVSNKDIYQSNARGARRNQSQSKSQSPLMRRHTI